MALIIPFPVNRTAPVNASGSPASVFRFPGLGEGATQAPCEAPSIPEPRSSRRKAQAGDDRKAMLAKIHIALTDLFRRARVETGLSGFCDDVYRFYLREQFGRDSAADLEPPELHNVLAWLQRLGWQPTRNRHRRSAPKKLNREERLGKIEAQLAAKGAAEGTEVPWGYAVAILKKQTGGAKTRLDDATGPELDAVIAALYRDAKRKQRKVR